MKILVVDPNREERENTARTLTACRHEVIVLADTTTALNVLTEKNVDVLVVELVAPGRSGTELIKRVRAREGNVRTFILATASRALPGDAGDAFQAGADDVIRKPMARDELVARVDGMNRIRKWAMRVFGGTMQDDAAADPCALQAWRTLDSTMSSEISDMLGTPFAIAENTANITESMYIAYIPVHLAAENLQVDIRVAAELSSAAELATTLLGDSAPGPDVMRDLMREIANAAAGSFKRLAAVEGKTFTIGIPKDAVLSTGPARQVRGRRAWVLGSGTMRIHFDTELRVVSNDLVPASSLLEGMVLAHDLLNASGALLLRGGTRLTQTQLEYVSRALGVRTLVEVANAA